MIEELKLQGEKVKKAKNFNYLGSTVSSNGRYEEVMRKIRKLSGKVKGKMYNRPTILYGMETTVAVTVRQMEKMEVAKLKMVRWALGVCERDCENCQAGRQTLECKATYMDM